MTELTQDLSLAQARSLIDSYAFDLGRDDAEKLLQYWLDVYHPSWIRLATIEALYLGRYKAISIEHILNVWLRLGNPNPHFTYEFERLICRKLPKHLTDLSDLTESATRTGNVNGHQTNLESQSKTAVSIGQEKDNVVVMVVEKDTLKLEQSVGNSGDYKKNYQKPNLSLISAMEQSYQSNWSEFTEGGNIIHQFIPLPDVSSFFNKLKTFGESKS